MTFREPVVAFRAPRSGRDARDARIRNALYLPRRVPSRRQHYLDARCRHFLTAALLDECAFPTANYSFRHQEDPPAGRLVAAPATPRGNRPLDTLLSLARLPFRRRNGLLLLRSYLHDRRLWRYRACEARRLLAPVEGLVGVLMCSLSMGYFFVVVNRILQGQPQRSPTASGTD